MQQEHQGVAFQDQNLHDYIAVILRRWKVAVSVFLLVFLGATLYTLTRVPVYEASTTLLVGGNGKVNLGLPVELMGNSGPSIATEIEIIKSRSIAEQVTGRLHLDWQVSGKSKGVGLNLAELSDIAGRSGYLVEMTGPDSFVVKELTGRIVGEGRNGVQMRGEGITLLLSDLHGKKGDGFQLHAVPPEGIVSGVMGGINGMEIGKTGVMRLSYADTDPARARDIVNTFAQVYLERSIEKKSREVSKSLEIIEQQLPKLREELENSEKNLQSYKKAAGIYSLDAEAQQIIGKLTGIDKQKTDLDIQKKQVEFYVGSLKEAIRNGKSFVPTDPAGAALANKIDELEVKKKNLLNEFTDAHPSVRGVQQQINETEHRLLVLYESSIRNLTRQQESVAKQLAGYEGELRGLPLKELEMIGLIRLNKINENIYTLMLQKAEETRIAKAATVSNASIIDTAVTPKVPIKPNTRKNILLGFLIGIMIGVGSALLIEHLDDTIKDAEDAKRTIGLPLLAVIPYISRRNGQVGITSLITRLEPKSPVAEAFRSLRTSLHFSAINREKKILLLTSTFPGEGKSTISSNLANILSQTGARVLIIDCDLRRSTLHEKFGHSKTPGLSEILTGGATFSTARHNLGIQGLDLISAGTTPPNPAELLGSEAMRSFLESHRENYDHIIIDAPPVLAVTDAPVLTAMSDMVLVVMESGRVPLKAAQRMREMLATVQAPVTGLVINDKARRGESYGGRYNSYGYGYGYGEELKKPWWKRLIGKK